MRQTSPLLAGPSPYGALSTPGSPLWSYTSPHMCSEGTASTTLCYSFFRDFNDFSFYLSKQVLGPVSAALCLLCLLGGQHDDEHNMAVAVGQRVCLLCLLISNHTNIWNDDWDMRWLGVETCHIPVNI